MSVISKEPEQILGWKQGKWGPKGSYPYRVRYGENWWKIAAKDGWTDVWDFIDFNFKTRNAAEVNWYLRNFVGCTLVAPDGKNLCFSDKLKPGIIYTKHQLQPDLPPPTYPIPLPSQTAGDDVDEPEPGVEPLNGTWVGLGVKVGGMVGPVGGEGVGCTLLASNRPELQVQTAIDLPGRLGPGSLGRRSLGCRHRGAFRKSVSRPFLEESRLESGPGG